jgi:hypothetical protein
MIIYRKEFLVISGVFLNRRVTRLRDQRCFQMVLAIFGNIGVLTKERRKSSDIVQKSFGGFRKGFGVVGN